jgi:hypothetical protein
MVRVRAPEVAPIRAANRPDAMTVEVLPRHQDTQSLERDLAGQACEDNDLVFCDEARPLMDNPLTTGVPA